MGSRLKCEKRMKAQAAARKSKPKPPTRPRAPPPLPAGVRQQCGRQRRNSTPPPPPKRKVVGPNDYVDCKKCNASYKKKNERKHKNKCDKKEANELIPCACGAKVKQRNLNKHKKSKCPIRKLGKPRKGYEWQKTRRMALFKKGN